MHPLLLFTLLFLPGIKSSHEVKQDFIDVRRNGGERPAISNTDIAPIEEPLTVDTTSLVKSDHDSGRLKPYESHVTRNFEKHKNKELLALKNDHEFLSYKDISARKHGLTSQENQYQTTPHYYEDKQFHRKNKVKYYEEKKSRNKMHDRKVEKKEFDESKTFKKNKGHKEEKTREYDREFIEKEKRSMKDLKKETSAKGKESHNLKKEQLKYKKASEKYLKKHFKYDNEMKRLERAKRHADSSESEEDDYNGDDEEDSDENVSLGSVEKHLVAHLLEVKDDSHPYEDTIEVKLKEKSGEDHELVPVVEDKITKTMAYISCGRKGGPGCGREQQEIGDHHDYTVHVKTVTKSQEDESDADHIDMEAWLKAFEDTIINTGIDVNYHNQ